MHSQQTRRNKDGGLWFAKVFVFFKCTGITIGMNHAAFVRWYTEVPNSERTAVLGMTRLKLATTQEAGEQGQQITVAWHDVIPIRDIHRPVFLQPDPTTKLKRWFFNPFVV